MKVVLPVEYCPSNMTVGGASKSLEHFVNMLPLTIY